MIVKYLLLGKQNFISNSERRTNIEGKWRTVMGRIAEFLEISTDMVTDRISY
jgi:uncharacterized protein YqgV (UPF0045/DUF77 family)